MMKPTHQKWISPVAPRDRATARPTKCLLLLAAIVAASMAGCSRPNPQAASGTAEEEPTAPSGPAGTPAEAVQRYEWAVHKGRLNALLDVLAEQDRKRFLKLKEVLEARDQAREAFFQAIESRFGKDPLTASRAGKIRFDRVIYHPGLRIEIVRETPEGPDKVRLALKFINEADPPEQPRIERRNFTALKEAGGWKLRDEDVPGGSEIGPFENQTRAFRQVTEQVKTGKFHNAKEALQAEAAAESSAVKKP